MSSEAPIPIGEMLRLAMRSWVTGVTVVTSRFEQVAHGMTVNSFGSISLDPPLVTVTMNHDTRTFALVKRSGVFAVTVLSSEQQYLAELFAGRLTDSGDRLAGLDTFTLATGAPFLAGGLAFVDCRVVYEYPLKLSTLLIGEVTAAEIIQPPRPSAETLRPAAETLPPGPEVTDLAENVPGPLIYYKRTFFKLD